MLIELYDASASFSWHFDDAAANRKKAPADSNGLESGQAVLGQLCVNCPLRHLCQGSAILSGGIHWRQVCDGDLEAGRTGNSPERLHECGVIDKGCGIMTRTVAVMVKTATG